MEISPGGEYSPYALTDYWSEICCFEINPKSFHPSPNTQHAQQQVSKHLSDVQTQTGICFVFSQVVRLGTLVCLICVPYDVRFRRTL